MSKAKMLQNNNVANALFIWLQFLCHQANAMVAVPFQHFQMESCHVWRGL